MSDFVGRDAFVSASGRRRYTEDTIPGVGRVRFRSLTGSEFAQLSSAQTRMVMACRERDTKGADRATREYYTKAIQLGVCDANGEPVFTADDRELVENMDAGVVERLVAGVTAHAGLDSVDVEGSAKNSEGTA